MKKYTFILCVLIAIIINLNISFNKGKNKIIEFQNKNIEALGSSESGGSGGCQNEINKTCYIPGSKPTWILGSIYVP